MLIPPFSLSTPCYNILQKFPDGHNVSSIVSNKTEKMLFACWDTKVEAGQPLANSCKIATNEKDVE